MEEVPVKGRLGEFALAWNPYRNKRTGKLELFIQESLGGASIAFQCGFLPFEEGMRRVFAMVEANPHLELIDLTLGEQ